MDRRLNAARTALQQREERLQEAFSYIERDLQLLGATGVEDKYGEQQINLNILVSSPSENPENQFSSPLIPSRNLILSYLIFQTESRSTV